MTTVRRAFTLLELLIVILLLSLFAFLIFGTLKREHRNTVSPSIPRLPEMMRTYSDSEWELVCLDNCRNCYALINHELHRLHWKFPPLKAYVLDPSGTPTLIDFGRLKDKKICLRLRKYAHGNLDPLLLESEGIFYLLPSYFGTLQHFDTLEEAFEYRQKEHPTLRDKGDYF